MRYQRKEEEGNRVSAQEALDLWNRYNRTGDLSVRNELVITLSPLVRYIVFKKVRGLPSRCEVDDFISCGWEALIQAIDRYDPARGTSLEQFAWTRIQGAVIDELRRQDWAPRSLRRREREVNQARESFAASTGRLPTTAELADKLEVDEDNLHAHLQSLEAAEIGSLNSVISTEGESMIERIDTIAAEGRGFDPEQGAEELAAKNRFREAFAQLGDRERTVAVMLYASNFTLREIGTKLGVSESRVCQIHAELKRRLRNQLTADRELLAAV